MLEWRAGSDGSLMADKGSLRLTIEAPALFLGEFRFTVLQRQYGRGSMFGVVETGARPRLHDAMKAAELAADRVAAVG